MKYFLLAFALTFAGCTSPIIENSAHNAVIPLGNKNVGIFIPESWEKITHPSSGKNIILMARNGIENVAISFEYSDEIVMGKALCEGAAKGFSPFEQTFVDEDQCFFSGHPAPNTPLRNFWQKIVRTPETTNFLLMSCSTEQQGSSISQCPELLENFKILDKKS